MPYSEDDLLPISALQHLAFCERQCALIHIEGAWAENRLTALGRQMHDHAHESDSEIEVRPGLRVARGLRLRSLRLGLSGVADVVEFHETEPNEQGIALPEIDGLWRPYPVEYKRGSPKPDDCDAVQLCAQALCLEEMLGTTISAGSLYYGRPRRRTEIVLTAELRERTESLAQNLHELINRGYTPPAVYVPKCRNCSLLETCLPRLSGPKHSARDYLQREIADTLNVFQSGKETS